MPKISGIYISPIKSCAMIRVPEARVTPHGLENDRIFALMNYDGNFLSQRRLPRLCLVTQEMRDDVLYVEAPYMPGIAIPLWEPEGPRDNIIIHGKACAVIDMGNALSDWFSEFLEYDCRLMGYSKRHPRSRMSGYLGRKINLALQDGYHALGISEASFVDLNRRIAFETGALVVPMSRFRPNLIFRGTSPDALVSPYEEDEWPEIDINGVIAEGASLCVRCATTTVNQSTSEINKEPLRTLAKYRKTPNGVIFGKNFVFLNEGVIKEGDIVKVIEI